VCIRVARACNRLCADEQALQLRGGDVLLSGLDREGLCVELLLVPKKSRNTEVEQMIGAAMMKRGHFVPGVGNLAPANRSHQETNGD